MHSIHCLHILLYKTAFIIPLTAIVRPRHQTQRVECPVLPLGLVEESLSGKHGPGSAAGGLEPAAVVVHQGVVAQVEVFAVASRVGPYGLIRGRFFNFWVTNGAFADDFICKLWHFAT